MGSIQEIGDVPSGPLIPRPVAECRQDVRQGQTAEIRYAQDAQVAAGVVKDRQQRNDMRMLQPGQRQVFIPPAGSDFQDDGPIAEAGLGGHDHAAMPAAPQLAEQVEFAEVLPRTGKVGNGRRFKGQNTLEQNLDLRLSPRKSPADFPGIDDFAVFVAEAKLFVN